MPDLDPNDSAKTVMTSALGEVPAVGAVLSCFLQIFWPNSKAGLDPEEVWDAIKDRVNAVVGDAIDAERVRNMEKFLAGLRNDLDLYVEAEDGRPDKNTFLDILIGNIALTEPFFYDEQRLEATLPYFTPMATLMISAWREKVLFHKQITGHDPTAKEQAGNEAQLKAHIDKYTTALRSAKQRLFDQYMEAEVPKLHGGHGVIVLKMMIKQLKEKRQADLDRITRLAETWPVMDVKRIG